MVKGRRPRPSYLVEKRKRKEPDTSQVDIPHEKIDPVFLDKFMGKIFFWSFTLYKVRANEHCTKLRVCTHRFVPKHKLFNLVESKFPEGVEVKLVPGYSFRHTFDVKLSIPMRVDTIVWRVVNALEGHI